MDDHSLQPLFLGPNSLLEKTKRRLAGRDVVFHPGSGGALYCRAVKLGGFRAGNGLGTALKVARIEGVPARHKSVGRLHWFAPPLCPVRLDSVFFSRIATRFLHGILSVAVAAPVVDRMGHGLVDLCDVSLCHHSDIRISALQRA